MPPKRIEDDLEKSACGSEEEEPHWHAMTTEETVAFMNLDPNIRHRGLTAMEAQKRLEEYGPNQFSEKERKTLWQKIWAQLCNVMVAILAFVAVVSFIKGIISNDNESRITNLIEFGLITFVVTLNTAIGVIQEGSAEKAAEALKSMLSSDAIVIRDSQEMKLPSLQLVPGDVVLLHTGDRVPGDLRLIEVHNLSCQEAALTGESVPINKTIDPILNENEDPKLIPLGDRKNMCFSATLVSQGFGVGIVVSTGDNTELGMVNKLVSKTEEKKTAVLEQLDFVSKAIAIFVVITATVTWFVSFFKLGDSALDAFSTALICAVAMIPEGLASIVTMTYSWSVAKMARENAIIRKLPAVETLGSVTCICSDKTGTLTKNEMSLVAFVTSNAHYRNDVDAKNRSFSNFVRDDDYMSSVAMRQSGSLRRNKQSTPSGQANSNDVIPVAPGQSPSQSFIRQALASGILCSKGKLGKQGGREGEIGNPTELSILRAAYFADIDVMGMKNATPVVAKLPFSSEYKFMATVHEALPENDGLVPSDEYVVHIKGAPDRMVKLCSHQAKAGMLGEENMEDIDEPYWTEKIAILSSHGLRVLALCRGTVKKIEVNSGDQLTPEFVSGRKEGPWLTIVGLCAIMDPPRPECVNAIAIAHKAGIRVAMITGDHRETARAIGDQLGLVNAEYPNAVTGPELDNMTETELRRAVLKYNIFARASPQNKIQIVKALQSEGQICSMTGDGVNDAPALKAADIGVAMGKEGTDVAREASEMILVDDNFATIVGAVREGRTVWDNLRKVLFINTPINNAQGMSVLFGILLGLPQSPLTPIQVLYCNLITAVTLGFVASVEPSEDGIMNKPPRRLGKRLIGRYLLLRIAVATVALVTVTVGSVFLVKSQYDLQAQRAQAMNTLSFGAVAVTLSARFTYNSSLHPRSLYGNRLALWSYGIMTFSQVFITYCPGVNSVIFDQGPMDWYQWVIVVIFSIAVLLVMEAEKAVRRYLCDHGADTDDQKFDPTFDMPDESNTDELFYSAASHVELQK